MTKHEFRIYYERHLPHYQPFGATLFITFRLAGSLPQSTILRLEALNHRITDQLLIHGVSANSEKVYLAQKQVFGFWDAELDSSRYGPHWLEDERIAGMICDMLKSKDGKEFTLEAYCIMPNHVHLMVTPLQIEGQENTYPLSRIMQSIKGSSARYANLILGREGAFWQHESYDHVVRDSKEYVRIVRYVMENPVRAGLNPRWVYCRISG